MQGRWWSGHDLCRDGGSSRFGGLGVGVGCSRHGVCGCAVVTGVASAVAKAVARDVKVIYGGGICSEGYQCQTVKY